MHRRKHVSLDHHPPLRDVTADTENSLLYCCILHRVYRAVAWQRVDQIRYSICHISLDLISIYFCTDFFSFFFCFLTSRVVIIKPV
jgi:hypothetical protein